MRKAVSFVLSFFLFVALAQAGPAFSLKLYGGAGYWLTGGDFKPFLQSTADRWSYVGYTGTVDLDWKPLSYEGGIQAILMFTPKVGLALGVGYLTKAVNQESSLKYGPTETLMQTNSYKIQSIPVSLDVLYALPAGPVRLLFSAGATYYSSQIKIEQHGLYSEPNQAGQPNWKWDLLQTFDSDRKGGLGFQAGLGLEVPLAGRIALCFDAFYRMVAFDDVEGTFRWDDSATWTGGHSGSSYSIEQAEMWYSTADVWGNIWHYLDISKGEPTTVDESRPFKISMSGPVLRVGIKIGV
jgi:hypothetical protein